MQCGQLIGTQQDFELGLQGRDRVERGGNALPTAVGEDDALGAPIVGIRLADDVAEALEVVDELPDRLGCDVRPRGDRAQPRAPSMSM